MRYCCKCVMPDTRPGEWRKPLGSFNEEGLCQACQNYEERKKVDWDDRSRHLAQLADKFRRNDGYYDCLIPVSGGKDSHYLTYMMKEKLGMNPLLVNVNDPFTHTQAGVKNLRNLSEVFNCDLYSFNISVDLFRKAVRADFEEFGHPLIFVEAAIYTVPTKLAINMGIPLLIHGENPNYEYGTDSVDYPSSMHHIRRIFDTVDLDFWIRRGFCRQELNPIFPPSESDLDGLMPIFMSYYDPWDGREHMEIAKRYGFRDLFHEQRREGNNEDYDQIDSVGWMMALWLKYVKFGYARTTDISCRWIREGRITRGEAISLVIEHDHKLDQRVLDDFLEFTGYTTRQFWDIVEKFQNREIFEKVGEVWRKKPEFLL